ncbi:hypothetical protein ONZ45_g2994 [Pleurotus djamor]|nr:hypothetical protein ONZ45_g2994 [Pleurotus djamor]
MLSHSPSKHTLGKGKEKATDDGNDHLNPVITFRHLHSHVLGIRDPLRVIALCDSDAFYAACEMVRLQTDPEKPLVVQQWESLIAVNYPARKFGISRMDRVKDAKKKCPELMCVHVATFKEGETEPGYWGEVDSRTHKVRDDHDHSVPLVPNDHKVSLDPYRKESAKILNIFKEGLPDVEIEKASIDEAFFDLTRPVRDAILQRYPHLSSVPFSGPDTPLPPPPPISWDALGHLIPINPTPSSDTCEEVGEGSNKIFDEEPPPTWHDVALSIGAELMFKTILRNAAIPSYLNEMPFQKIRFLGGKLGKAIAAEYDVSTVGDLLSISVVKAKPPLPKSMLSAKNLLTPITQVSQGKHWIRVLATDLAHRLKEARLEHPTLWPKTLALGAYKSYQNGRSKQAPFPFVRDVTIDVVASAGEKLWRELMSNADESTLKISHIYLQFSGVGTAENGQGSIEGFLKSPATANIQSTGKRERTLTVGGISDDEDDTLPDTSQLVDEPSTNTPNLPGLVATSHEDQPDLSFTCERCGKDISPNKDSLVGLDISSGDPDVISSLIKHKLDSLRREHEDYHFALELTRQTNGPLKAAPPSRKSTNSSKKKRKVETQSKSKPTGIEHFFHAK